MSCEASGDNGLRVSRVELRVCDSSRVEYR
jgi:hypothetical protein